MANYLLKLLDLLEFKLQFAALARSLQTNKFFQLADQEFLFRDKKRTISKIAKGVLVDQPTDKLCWTKCRLSENGDWLQRAAMTRCCNEILYRAVVACTRFRGHWCQDRKKWKQAPHTGVVFSTALAV